MDNNSNSNTTMMQLIQEALESVFTKYDWKETEPTEKIIHELTIEANRLVDAIYSKYDMVRQKKFPESFVSFMIGQIQNYEELMEDETPRPPVIEEVIRPSLLDDVAEYDPLPSSKFDNGTVAMPEGFADNLQGNPDAVAWTEAFSTIMRYNPHWAEDESYMLGFFANAIGAGYGTAKQEEHPYLERNPDEYVYIEFYELEEVVKTNPDEVILDQIRERVSASRGKGESLQEREKQEVVKYTFAFATLAAAQTFVRLNEGKTEMPTFYRMYELSPTTTYEKVPIR